MQRHAFSLIANDIKESLFLDKTLAAALRQQVSKHAHTHRPTHTHTLSLITQNYNVHCNLLSPVRVMILLYLHGFSYIDLGQKEVPPVGAPFLLAPHPVTIVPECACVQNTSSWCVQVGRKLFKRRNYLKNPDLSDIYFYIYFRLQTNL